MGSCMPTKLCDPDHLLLGCVWAPELEVVAERPLEEVGLLEDDAHLSAERLELHLPEVHAVDGDRPRVGVVEASDEVDDARLARAGGAEDSEALPGARLDVYPLEDRLILHVAEAHVLQLDDAFSLGEVDGVWCLLHLGVDVEDDEDALCARECALYLSVEGADVLDRLEVARRVLGEGDQVADGEVRAEDLLASEEPDERADEGGEEADGRLVDVGGDLRLYLRLRVGDVDLVEVG